MLYALAAHPSQWKGWTVSRALPLAAVIAHAGASGQVGRSEALTISGRARDAGIMEWLQGFKVTDLHRSQQTKDAKALSYKIRIFRTFGT